MRLNAMHDDECINNFSMIIVWHSNAIHKSETSDSNSIYESRTRYASQDENFEKFQLENLLWCIGSETNIWMWKSYADNIWVCDCNELTFPCEMEKLSAALTSTAHWSEMSTPTLFKLTLYLIACRTMWNEVLFIFHFRLMSTISTAEFPM